MGNMRSARNAPKSSEPEGSLYARVLADPEAREAFFNTTQAQLFGDPDSEVVNDIVELLDRNAVAFLFSPDTNLARPVLQVESRQFVGNDEVRRAIGHFLIRTSPDFAA